MLMYTLLCKIWHCYPFLDVRDLYWLARLLFPESFIAYLIEIAMHQQTLKNLTKFFSAFSMLKGIVKVGR
ncbi:hypothetical protein KDA_00670 [Dictyobacter alpinus]|uniref:Uncharacterized protein n=1 Tax=Dictyobacter alpinus TaxID=2014873 RepID=A0A402AZS6_9CHLR|nr:hypothetical protein KDA_00670 [Dictyobacter alpinus]